MSGFDTSRSNYDGNPCSDCQTTEPGAVYLRHSGPLVPQGAVGYFCEDDFKARRKENIAGLEPRPLGTKPRELPY